MKFRKDERKRFCFPEPGPGPGWGWRPDPKPSSFPTGFPSFCKHPGPLVSPTHSAPPFLLLPSLLYWICLHISLQDSHMNLLAFLKREGHHSASGPLHLLFPLPGTVCPPFHSCASLRSVLKRQVSFSVRTFLTFA